MNDTAVTVLAIYAAIVTAIIPLLLGRLFKALAVESLPGISMRIHVAIMLLDEVVRAPRYTAVEEAKLQRAVYMLLAEQEVYAAQHMAQQMRDVTPSVAQRD